MLLSYNIGSFLGEFMGHTDKADGPRNGYTIDDDQQLIGGVKVRMFRLKIPVTDPLVEAMKNEFSYAFYTSNLDAKLASIAAVPNEVFVKEAGIMQNLL